jgi:peptide/nickel transport system substrate-binding protein/oligopeptide transport system substrate-binding protein
MSALFPRLILPVALVLSLAACGRSKDGPLPIALIGDKADFRSSGVRLSPAAQTLRAASVEGLVGFDADGRVVPGLADRWIITDDGQSYIFRLRDGTWPDGSRLTADAVAAALRKALAALKGTALGLDLAGIDQIRVMADRVIEVDLVAPIPDLLTLLAQPELGLPHSGRGSGPMGIRINDSSAVLTMIPPEKRGLAVQDDGARHNRSLTVELVTAGQAVNRFNDGFVDVVLGGTVDTLPLAGVTALSRGNVQLDPVIGLYGLMVDSESGFLADAPNREALALAIDRDALIAAFNVGGWLPTTRIVSNDVEDDPGTIGERWTEQTPDQRRALAAERVARWKAAGHEAPTLTIALPDGPGSALLLERLTADFGAIGVTLTRAAAGKPASLRLVDSVARYGRATWFLNQLACSVRKVACNSVGDQRLADARAAHDPHQRAALLAEAEAEITAANGYIPIARPLRWSMTRSGVYGFAPNPWGTHSLTALATLPK